MEDKEMLRIDIWELGKLETTALLVWDDSADCETSQGVYEEPEPEPEWPIIEPTGTIHPSLNSGPITGS